MDQLQTAVQGLYSHESTGDQRSQFNSYLESFQKSSEAWQICHDVLNDSACSASLKGFCAQTLKLKISRDLHQIPAENRLALKDSAKELLKKNVLVDGIGLVGVQLSVALADLALQLLSWNNVLPELISEFGNSPQLIKCLLEFLKVLPEELVNPKHTLLTDAEFKDRSRQLVQDRAEDVFKLLLSYSVDIKSNILPASFKGLLFECFNSWLVEIRVEDIVLNRDALAVFFDALLDETSRETAADCICTLIKETSELEAIENLGLLITQIVGLRGTLLCARDEHDEDLLEYLARIFSQAGYSWHPFIARYPDQFLRLVECIAECTAVEQDLEVVAYTFSVWHSIKQVISSDGANSEAGAAANAKFGKARQVFHDIYFKLIHVFMRQVRYPDGEEGSDLFDGDREAEDKFKDFRYEVGDVLKCCCNIVGPNIALNEVYQQLKKNLTLANVTWQDVEAPLFCMRVMAREIPNSDETVLPDIIRLLLELPENPKVRYAATLVLGRYTEWTAKHPEFIDIELNYVMEGFNTQNSEVISAAAQTIMYFCRDCRSHLRTYIEQLYTVFKHMLLNLDQVSLQEVTDGIGHIILAQQPEAILPAVKQFGQPIVEKLSGLMAMSNSDPVAIEKCHTEIGGTIELLTILVDVVRPPFSSNEHFDSATAEFVADILPVIKSVVDAHGSSPIVSERCCKFLKNTLHSCGTTATPLVPSIAPILVDQFNATHYGCYLWASGGLIREFGADLEDKIGQNITSAVWAFAESLISSFLGIFDGPQFAHREPDLIEDFFRFIDNALMYYPVPLINSPSLEPILQCCLLCLELEQQEPLTACLQFLHGLCDFANGRASSSVFPQGIPASLTHRIVELARSEFGRSCTITVVHGLTTNLAKDCSTDASSLLLSLFTIVPHEVALLWLAAAVDTFPSGAVSSEDREKFLGRIDTSIQSRDFKRVRSLLRDFTAIRSRKAALSW